MKNEISRLKYSSMHCAGKQSDKIYSTEFATVPDCERLAIFRTNTAEVGKVSRIYFIFRDISDVNLAEHKYDRNHILYFQGVVIYISF